MKKILFLILIFLGACVVGPNYHRPIVKVPYQYKEAPPGWKFADPQEGCARGKWWLIFNDPILDKLEEQVQISNQNIAAAIGQYNQARALVEEARAAYFPVLSGSASVTRQKSASSFGSNSSALLASSTTSTTVGGSSGSNNKPFTIYNLSLDATWAPDLWGQVQRTVEASVAGAQASAAQLALVTLTAQASLAQYYFELRGLDADQNVLNEIVADYQKLLTITENQYAAGTAARANILAIEISLKTAQTNAYDNTILRGQYEHAIATLIGQLPSLLTVMPHPYQIAQFTIPLEMSTVLLERRPDIAQAERLVAQANAEIGVAIAAFFPVLNLSATGGFTSNMLSSLFSKPAQFWSLGAQLYDTLFDGGLRSAKVTYARAVYEEAVAQYRQTVLLAFQNVEDNLVALRQLDQEEVKQAEIVALAKHELQIVINQYESGTAARSDILNTQINLYTLQKNANDINYRRMVSTVNLILALGGGWDDSQIYSMSVK